MLLDGQHVPSSPSHPHKMLRTSSNVLLAVSAFMMIAGFFGIWGRTWIEALFGIFYLVGALVLRSGRRLGAAITAVPLVINVALLIVVALAGEIEGAWVMDAVLCLLFTSFVVRAWQAARDSRLLTLTSQKSAPSPAALPHPPQ